MSHTAPIGPPVVVATEWDTRSETQHSTASRTRTRPQAPETNLRASPVGQARRSVSQPDVHPKGFEPLTF
jgi:hypothetical protein